MEIKGIWSSRAGDYNPQPAIKTRTNDYRFFYRFTHDSKEQEKRIIQIVVGGKTVIETHDWLSKDGREDNFFDVPLEYRKPGRIILRFRVFEPESKAADSKAGKLEKEFGPFSIEYFE